MCGYRPQIQGRFDSLVVVAYCNKIIRLIYYYSVHYFDQNMCTSDRDMSCGSTALGIFIRDNTLVAFNVGDCHAVLSSNGVAVSEMNSIDFVKQCSNALVLNYQSDLSNAHKPGRPDEYERIQRANAWVTEER